MNAESKSHNTFGESVKDFLGENYNKIGDGLWKGKRYKHILSLDNTKKGDKVALILNHNVLPAARNEPFLIEKNLHMCAHHLNSSQIMCYNFFRPFVKGYKESAESLIELLQQKLKITIDNPKNASCKFEYEQKKEDWKWEYNNKQENEGTSFDFYITSDCKEIFFEIKYTENGFGTCKNDKKHKCKFDKLYKRKIESSHVIKEEKKKELCFETFRKHYQLFRNVLRVICKNKYVVFIYPKDNSIVHKQYENFVKEYISDDYKEQVRGIDWEYLIDDNSEFKKKYFGYKH